MGKRGDGTIVQIADGTYWVALQDHGRRFWRRAKTLEEAEDRLARLKANRARGKTDRLMGHTRRRRATGWVIRVLEEGERQGWSNEMLARVLVAQLAPRRVIRDIFGPCVYCGTWIAATIDHVIPTSIGGPDTSDNIASACLSCNSRKGNRTDGLPDSLPRPEAAA